MTKATKTAAIALYLMMGFAVMQAHFSKPYKWIPRANTITTVGVIVTWPAFFVFHMIYTPTIEELNL